MSPFIILSAYLTGLVWLKPHSEDSNPIVIHLKGDKQELVQGRMVYILSKFALIDMVSKSGEESSLIAINLDDVSQIEHLPAPKSTATPTPSPKTREPQPGQAAKKP